MGRKILEALYSGDLRLNEHNPPDTEEYEKAKVAFEDEIGKLPEDEQKKVLKLLELQTQVTSYEVKNAFFRGLAIGVRFMSEIQTMDLKLDNFDRILEEIPVQSPKPNKKL